MNKNIIFIIFSLLFISSEVFGQQESLTLEQCVALAIKNNPQIKIAENNFYASEANYNSVQAQLYPQLFLQSGWVQYGGTNFIGPNEIKLNYANYSAGFQLSQLVYDFGKTYNQVTSFSDLKDASAQDLITAKQNLILNTHIAYYNYLQSQRQRDVTIDIVKQTEEHLVQAKAFFTAGTNSQYDVLKASTDLANAKVNQITADNNLKIAKVQLENVLNTNLNDNFSLQDNLDVKPDTVNLVNALASAYQNRSELISGNFIIEADKSALSSAWDANLPSISLSGAYNFKSKSLAAQFPPSWNVGLNLSLPIFQGFLLEAGLNKAKANLQIAEATKDATELNIKLDVQQQYLTLIATKESITATSDLVKQSEETLKLAEGRFKEGVGSSLEITDARVTLFNAKISYIQSLYNYHITYARLLRAMGSLK